MESFYGGKQGFSFIIVKNFASIDEMVQEFKKGPEYTAVHFNEHVLINTENKNDPDNGKIYRRGYDFSDDLGGAVYVGTIVGPAGKAPMLELTTVQEVREKQAGEGYDYRAGEGEYAPTADLVPGKQEDGTFNDSIKWAYCSVRNENDEDCTAYIGFIFPYLVEDFEANSVDPYYNRDKQEENFNNTDLIDRIDEKDHPYYAKWKISIPKGIKGDSLNNFKVVTASADIQDYEGRQDDINNSRQVLVYDYYHYDKEAGGEPATLYLGDYNMIDKIDINDDGTITIDYSHDDDKIFNKLLKWITSVTLDTETGRFTVTYNQETDVGGSPTTYTADLAWVKDIQIAEDGKVTLNFSTGDSKELEVGLRWVNDIELAADGTVTVNYNDNTSDVFQEKIQWISEIQLYEDGQFIVRYNNGAPEYQTRLQWVNNITIDDDGTINVLYNTGESTKYDQYLKVIKDVQIQTAVDDQGEGSGDQKVHITYNNNEEVAIGEPLNYIIDSVIVPENYHYLVYYSDPEKRQEIVDSGKNYSYQDKDDWYDMGSIKDESGILIGLNISLSDNPLLNSMAAAIEYLNSTYPNGLTEEQGVDLKGKIVTVGDDEGNKSFYAFDYSFGETGSYKGWYYLGTFSININEIFMIAGEADSDFTQKKNRLGLGGFWFVVEGEDE